MIYIVSLALMSIAVALLCCARPVENGGSWMMAKREREAAGRRVAKTHDRTIRALAGRRRIER